MALHCFSFGRRKSAQVAGFGNVHCEAFGAEIIRYPSSPPDEHRGSRLASDVNKQSIIGLWRLMPHFDFMGRLAQRQFAQTDKGLFAKEILQGFSGLCRLVDDASLQAIY